MAYGEDLSFIHDQGFGWFANGAAPGLLATLRSHGVTEGTVVDLGCGSGIWAKILGEAGYRPIGVDQSPAMIALARRQASSAVFHVASFVDFEIPRCRAITALGEVLCYLFDEKNTHESFHWLLQRAFSALEPGGLLIFDVAEIGLDIGRPPAIRQTDDWYCATEFEYDHDRRRLIRHITTFRKTGDLFRRAQEHHRVQLHDAETVASTLREIGFEVEIVRSYGDYPLLQKRVGFLAKKPG
jgi:SAM-dependent methyltransferase